MAGKFSLLTSLTLNAAGFNEGLNKAKQKTSDFAKGVETAQKSVKTSFSGISNVAGGLGETLNQSLGGLPSMLSTALSGFKGMVPAITSIKTALISTGIGAIVVALGVAFSALTSYLNGTSEGAAKVKEMFGYISGAATALMNRLKSLGSALFSILTGDIEGFKKSIQEAFKGGFIDEVVDAAKMGNELAKEQNRLKKEKNKLDSEELDVIYKQAELTTKAKDVTKESNYSAKQRLEFEKEAVRIGDEFDEKKIKYLKDAWNLEVNLNKQKTQLNQSDIDKELAAKKAYFDYIIKDRQDAIGENKIIAKTQKEIDSDALDAAKERIALEKQIGTERLGNIQLSNSFDQKGKIKSYTPKNTKDFEGDKLTKDAESKINSATAKLQKFKVDTKNMLLDMNNIVISGLNQLGSSIASSFANIITGEEGAGFKQLFSSILSTVGEFITQMGAAVMAYGITMEAFKKAFSNPFAAIAAGIGLMIVGGVVSNLANSIGEKTKGYANGGIVGGNSFTGDKVVARVNSGEMILNKKQQSNLLSLANGGGSFGGDVRFEIDGQKLVGVLNNYNKKVRNTR